jgi:hypothetical protein
MTEFDHCLTQGRQSMLAFCLGQQARWDRVHLEQESLARLLAAWASKGSNSITVTPAYAVVGVSAGSRRANCMTSALAYVPYTYCAIPGCRAKDFFWLAWSAGFSQLILKGNIRRDKTDRHEGRDQTSAHATSRDSIKDLTFDPAREPGTSEEEERRNLSLKDLLTLLIRRRSRVIRREQ